MIHAGEIHLYNRAHQRERFPFRDHRIAYGGPLKTSPTPFSKENLKLEEVDWFAQDDIIGSEKNLRNLKKRQTWSRVPTL